MSRFSDGVEDAVAAYVRPTPPIFVINGLLEAYNELDRKMISMRNFLLNFWLLFLNNGQNVIKPDTNSVGRAPTIGYKVDDEPLML